MTDEQAIVYLESLKEYVDKIAYAPDMYGAIDKAIQALERQPFDIHMVNPTDDDYPLVMKNVPFAEKYQLMCIDKLMLIPLYQVLDEISKINCGSRMNGGGEE